MLLQISWRNIWRNPKRTLIILVAVVIGVWAMIVFGALSRGMARSMLANSLNTLTGHIQVMRPEYRDDKAVENRIKDPGDVAMALKKHLPPGSRWAFRIEVGGVASNARHSQGVSIVGIDPDREGDISFYGDTLAGGRWLNVNDPHGIVVGKALADDFGTRLGRKLVLMSQGADGETASRAFKIRGVFRAELAATEKQIVFVTLGAAQKMLGMENGVTGACVKLTDLDEVDNIVQALGPSLPTGVSALGWKDLLPLLNGYLGMFDSFMLLWYVVVFTAMAFGLVNTMLMAVLERTREFGLLKALGMKPAWIVTGVLTECLMLLAVGLGAGNLLGLGTVHMLSGGIDLSFMARGAAYFGMGHIMVPFLTLKDVVSANLVVLVLGQLVCLYPAVKAGRITPVRAMAQT